MMIIENNNQMDGIQDAKTIEILQKMYHLEVLKEESLEKDALRENPIILGSITNWKPIQTLSLYQYVTAVSC